MEEDWSDLFRLPLTGRVYICFTVPQFSPFGVSMAKINWLTTTSVFVSLLLYIR